MRAAVGTHLIKTHTLRYGGRTPRLSCFSDDYFDSVFAAGRFYEEDLLAVIDATVAKCGVYVDVGAHVGNHTLFFALFCAPQVLSFEPCWQNFSLLQKNIADNGIRNVQLVNKAVGRNRGRCGLQPLLPRNSGANVMIPGNLVEVVTLDSFCQGMDVTLLKIDVEGREDDVLAGAANTIRKSCPVVFAECQTAKRLDNITRRLRKYDYQVGPSYGRTPVYCFQPSSRPQRSADRSMNWAVGVTTAPRPIATLEQTLKSLKQAGFGPCQLFDDRTRTGAWRNWLRAVRELLEKHPNADALLICQDDVVLCRGLREYLEGSLWPADDVAVCSPYCPTLYRSPQPGWHREDHGWDLVGAVCWAIPRTAAEAMLRDLGQVKADRHIDARIGRWALQTGRSVWYHSPSLAQHVAPTNSALGHNLLGSRRQAADFVGEAYLLPTTGGPRAPWTAVSQEDDHAQGT